MENAEAQSGTRWNAILHARCPRCRVGGIFKRFRLLGLPAMQEHCPVCGLRFEREQGYFLGAMYFSYALAVPLMALWVGLFWWLTDWRVEKLILAAALALVPCAPFLTTLARVLWIHFDRAIDPE